MSELCHVLNRLTFVIHDNIATGGFIALDVKTAVSDSDQRHKLVVIVFDEKNLPIANFESRRAINDQCVFTDFAAEHSDGVGSSRISFDVLCDLKCNVSLNVTLGALAFPN